MRLGEREPQPVVSVGVDLGQGRQPTGLCVVEVQDRVGTDRTPGGHHYAVRYLERLPPGTPYPAPGAASAGGTVEAACTDNRTVVYFY